MNVKVFSPRMLDSLTNEANSLPRRRKHLNIHQTYDELCQRLLNAIGVDSYIRPHRHSLDPKVETLVAVRGLFALIVFDETGAITTWSKFGTECYAGDDGVPVGVEVDSQVWHTVIALSDGATLFEVKAGPFDPHAAKEFAEWAPAEGTGSVADYLARLHQVVSGDLVARDALPV